MALSDFTKYFRGPEKDESGEEGAESSEKPVEEPEPKPKELSPLSQRVGSGSATKNIAWQLRSHKNYIYEKYRITGKEVDEFANDLTGKVGSHLDSRESRGIEKKYGKMHQYGSSLEKVKGERWGNILRDPNIFKN